MKKRWIYGLVPVACLALVACGGKGKEPTGQVVATVDGDEITLTELRSELAGVNLPDPNARKAAEQRALQMIIDRKVIAKAAQEQKLDKTPQFALQEERTLEVLRANALQKRIVESVPEPTAEEVTRFIGENPNIFAQRKIFVVDQLRVAAPVNPQMLKEFEPLKTLEEVEALLKTKGMNYQRATDNIDSLGNNPKLVDAIVKLPPGEVFVVPAQRLILMNRVVETRVQPFTGEPANQYAKNMMKVQRTQDALQTQMGALVKAAQPTIKYNKDYKPPAAPAAKAPQPKA